MDKCSINLVASLIEYSVFNHLIKVTHGECQEEVVNLSGRKIFYFALALLIFILAYKNSVARITGIQNIFSEVTVITY